MATASLTGFRELDAKFASLPDSIRRKSLRKGTQKGGRALAKEMRSRAPNSKRTGSTDLLSSGAKAKRAGNKPIAKSMKIRPSRQWPSRGAMARIGIIGASVGPEWPFGAAAHLLEYGHALVAWGRPTSIRIKPQPFMRPAFDVSKGRVMSAYHSELSRQIKAETAKL